MAKFRPECVGCKYMVKGESGAAACVVPKCVAHLRTELAAAKEANRWMSVEEGLPESLKDVQFAKVYHTGGKLHWTKGYYVKDKGWFDIVANLWVGVDRDNSESKVVYWRLVILPGQALPAVQGEVGGQVEVWHPIDDKGKVDRRCNYCSGCGAGVRTQKYCHNCGRKLLWPAQAPKGEKVLEIEVMI